MNELREIDKILRKLKEIRKKRKKEIKSLNLSTDELFDESNENFELIQLGSEQEKLTKRYHEIQDSCKHEFSYAMFAKTFAYFEVMCSNCYTSEKWPKKEKCDNCLSDMKIDRSVIDPDQGKSVNVCKCENCGHEYVDDGRHYKSEIQEFCVK